jgi:hypothetical protein
MEPELFLSLNLDNYLIFSAFVPPWPLSEQCQHSKQPQLTENKYQSPVS